MSGAAGPGPAPLEPPPRFLELAAQQHLDFDAGDVERLGRYLALLLETNQQFNLTAVTAPEEAWVRHAFDALTLLPLLVEIGAEVVIDVGSGGGVPGIPLAICLPDVRFTLAEATGKKARFLEQAAGQLGLANVAVIAERAETLGQDRAHRERYDAAVARAVGPLPVLLELTMPLVRSAGHVLAIKGEKAEQEIAGAERALHELRGEVAALQRTPTGTIVAITKLGPTPRMYPRRPGEPKRTPL